MTRPSFVVVGKPEQYTASQVVLSDSDTTIMDAGHQTGAAYPGAGNINFPEIIRVTSAMTGLTALGLAVGELLIAFSSHNSHCIYFARAASISATPTMLGSDCQMSRTLSLGRSGDGTAFSPAGQNVDIHSNPCGLLYLNPDWGAQGSSNDHFASPCYVYDSTNVVHKMYFHATAQKTGVSDGWTHGAGVAVSAVDLSVYRARALVILLAQGFTVPTGFANAGSGLSADIATYLATVCADVPSNEICSTWRILPIKIGEGTGGAAHYFRVFVRSGVSYAVSNQGDLRRSELSGVACPLGISPFEERSNQNTWNAAINDNNQSPALQARHVDLYVAGDTMIMAFSRPQDADPNSAGAPYPDQEHLQISFCDVSGDWSTWTLGPPKDWLRSETSDENLAIALDGAHGGAVPANKRILMDPKFFMDDSGVLWLLYVVSEDRIKRRRVPYLRVA